MNKIIPNFDKINYPILPRIAKWGFYTVTILGASYALYRIYNYCLKNKLTNESSKLFEIKHNEASLVTKKEIKQLKLPDITFNGVTIPSDAVNAILKFLDWPSHARFTQVCQAARLYKLYSTLILYPDPCLWATFIDEKLHTFFSTNGTVKIFNVAESDGICKSSDETTHFELKGKSLNPRAGFYLHNALINWEIPKPSHILEGAFKDIFKLKKEEAGFVRTKKYEYTYTPYSLKIGCDSHCWGMVYDAASDWWLQFDVYADKKTCKAKKFKKENWAFPQNQWEVLKSLEISLPSYILCYQIVLSHTLILGCEDGTINMYNILHEGKHFKTYKISEPVLDFAFLNGFLWVATAKRLFALNKEKIIQ